MVGFGVILVIGLAEIVPVRDVRRLRAAPLRQAGDRDLLVRLEHRLVVREHPPHR